MKRKENILPWILFIIPAFIFGYEILNKSKLEREEFHNLQSIEFLSVFVFLFSVGFFEIYKKIKNIHFRLILFCIIFLLLTTVKYEFYSNLLIVIHALCYLFILIFLLKITLKSDDE